MNKSELVDSIAERAGLSKAEAERALNAFIESVQGAVASDDKVTLAWFRLVLAFIPRRAHGSQPAHGRAGTDRGVEGREVLCGSRLQVRREQVGRAPPRLHPEIPRERW